MRQCLESVNTIRHFIHRMSPGCTKSYHRTDKQHLLDGDRECLGLKTKEIKVFDCKLKCHNRSEQVFFFFPTFYLQIVLTEES